LGIRLEIVLLTVHAFGVLLEVIVTRFPETELVYKPKVATVAPDAVQSVLPVGTKFNLFELSLVQESVVDDTVPDQVGVDGTETMIFPADEDP
jgi:hypothetical protein